MAAVAGRKSFFLLFVILLSASSIFFLIGPKIPSHVLESPHGSLASQAKTAIWSTVFKTLYSGIPPDWCGYRQKDGAIMLVYYSLIAVTDAGRSYTGIAVIFNKNSGPSTAIWDLKKDLDPEGGNRPINRASQVGPFEDMNTCPGPGYFATP